ncbi:MAG TPA: WYL domain-containing protein [Spirochaetota bacterium]|nr:WYL domain-containing protein [Spirochaetota bacterium]
MINNSKIKDKVSSDANKDTRELLSKPNVPNDPATKIRIMERYLHILALIQNPEGIDGGWTDKKIADRINEVLENKEGSDDSLTDDKVNRDIKTLRDDLNISISGQGTSRRMIMDTLDPHLQITLLEAYAPFVITDNSRDLILDNIVQNNSDYCAWNIAAVKYALTMNRYCNNISATYTLNFDYASKACNHTKDENREIVPYHLVFKNNNLYLIGLMLSNGLPVHNSPTVYLFEKIKEIKLKKSDKITHTVPPVKEIYKNSTSSFINQKTHDVVIRYTQSAQTELKRVLPETAIETEIKDANNSKYSYETRFISCDDIYLCKELFVFGDQIEIIKPTELRKMMFDNAQAVLDAYGV